MPNTVDILFRAQTDAAQAKLNQFLGGLQGGLNKLADGLRTGLGIDIARRLVDTLAQIPQQLDNAVRRGVAFNQTLEDSRLGIAAIIKQFNSELTFDQALARADEALKLLSDKAGKSPAILKELVAAFQGLSAAASGANIPLNQQVDLVVLLSQALAGLGIRSEQLLQESRALLTGNIDQNAAAARTLEITREQIMAAREQGQLYEFLTGKLAGFAEAGERAAGNFSQRTSNLTDTLDQVLGRLSRGIFETAKAKLGELLNVISRPEFEQQLQGLAARINDGVNAFANLGIAGVKHIGAISTALQVLAGTLAAATAALVVLKGAGFIAALFGGPLLSLKDFLAAVKLLPGLIAGSRLLMLANWIASVTAVLWLGVEAWKAWGAKKEEATAIGNLSDANRKLAASILAVVDAREKAGELSAEKAAELRGIVTSTMEDADFLGRGLTSDVLRDVAHSLTKGDEKPGAPTAKKKNLTQEMLDAERALNLRRGQAELLVTRATIDNEIELNQRMYQAKERQLDGFLARRRTLATETYTAEVKQLGRVETDLRARLLIERDQAEKKKILADVADVEAQRKVLAIDFEKALTAITYEGEEERKQLREKAAKDAEEQREKLKRDMQERAQRARAEREIEFAEQQGQVRRVEMDPDLGREERKRKLIPLLEKERDLIAEQIAFNKQRLTDPALDEDARIQAKRDLLALEDKHADSLRKTKDLEADSFMGTMRRNLQQLSDEWGAVGQNIAGTLTGGIKSAVDGVSQGIMGMIDGTMTWGQVFSQVARGIVSNLIQVFTQWVAQELLLDGIRELISGKKKARDAGEAAAAAPKALMESISSWGVAALIGGAALIAAMALLPGRAEGGPVEPGQPFLVGEQGKEVFWPNTAGVIIPNFKLPELNIAGPRFSQRNAGASAASAAPKKEIHVVMVDSEAAALRVLKSNMGEEVFLHHFNKHRFNLGIES